ncbi:uncharacterized protein MONOS_12840 [Monocercomonoides exilis]|uniref:uncharacterized protein n=1 Tax=Monocercomonoides exilis TaxID=2049356 RepID=UPI0035597024|nr:hypothetical protein MONOS_12840 [Monocercomonoides exilis]|eukprot:MONOS_12840.1-p1 / transcript=MONOS_12840.1 / gene=MONOS_12840 / organism=Monocercomonoides_exilis_PA203 / gene_product=unspecified product / transcript_product=unspecified product / location=Mono_scaffold00741:1216-2023(+) / protein_length=220 / sequence_SO=supercontig / SO=protein_coding / is_pseudo=false
MDPGVDVVLEKDKNAQDEYFEKIWYIVLQLSYTALWMRALPTKMCVITESQNLERLLSLEVIEKGYGHAESDYGKSNMFSYELRVDAGDRRVQKLIEEVELQDLITDSKLKHGEMNMNKVRSKEANEYFVQRLMEKKELSVADENETFFDFRRKAEEVPSVKVVANKVRELTDASRCGCGNGGGLTKEEFRTDAGLFCIFKCDLSCERKYPAAPSAIVP